MEKTNNNNDHNHSRNLQPHYRENNLRLRGLPGFISNMPGIAKLIDNNMKVIDINRGAEIYLSRLGLKIEDVRGKFCYEGIWGRSAPCSGCPIKSVLDTGEPVSRIISRDIGSGREITFVSHMYPIHDNNDNIAGIVDMWFDISYQQEKEVLLQRYELLKENARDIILIVDMDARIIEANTAALAAYGYTREQLLQLKLHDICHENYRWQINKQMQEAEKSGILFETMHQRKDGSSFLVEVSCTGADLGDSRVLLSVIRDISERKQSEKYLQLTSVSIEKASVEMSWLDKEGNILNVNETACSSLEYSKNEMKQLRVFDINPTITQSKWGILWEKLINTGTVRYQGMHLSRSGINYPVDVTINYFKYEEEEYAIAFAFDTTERIEHEKALIKSEAKYHALFENMLDAFALHRVILDEKGTPIDYEFVEVNEAFEKTMKMNRYDLIGRRVTEIFPGIENEEFDWIGNYGRVALTGKSKKFIQYWERFARWYSISAYSHETGYFATSFSDITEQKKAEKRTWYLSTHDELTGLYNRAFFKEETRRLDVERQLPLSIIVGDVNGLKLANDAFGHFQGDRLLQAIAENIKKSCRKEDIIARWGGDEFIILLPQTSEKVADNVCDRIRKACQASPPEPIQPSIALGSASKTEPDVLIESIVAKAENSMYHNKLLESKDVRDFILSSLENRLGEKTLETREHSERMHKLARVFGEKLQLTEYELERLGILARVHDIGMIGVPSEILMKTKKLTENEWRIIKQHSEIGYRIAHTAPELSPVADDILSHHERWDGSGYPRGLSGKTIPLLARIISIVDAYDVMTHARPYRKPISSADALKEIKISAGTYFDPDLVEAFIVIINKFKID